MKRFAGLLGVFLFVCGISFAVHAQESVDPAMGSCTTPDCAQAHSPRGRHEIKKHARRGKWKEARAEMHASCKDDAKALCSDVTPGHGAILICLAEKVEQIKNAECKAKIAEGKLKFQKRMEKMKARNK